MLPAVLVIGKGADNDTCTANLYITLFVMKCANKRLITRGTLLSVELYYVWVFSGNP